MVGDEEDSCGCSGTKCIAEVSLSVPDLFTELHEDFDSYVLVWSTTRNRR